MKTVVCNYRYYLISLLKNVEIMKLVGKEISLKINI